VTCETRWANPGGAEVVVVAGGGGWEVVTCSVDVEVKRTDVEVVGGEDVVADVKVVVVPPGPLLQARTAIATRVTPIELGLLVI
jgi:hypothetical protein